MKYHAHDPILRVLLINLISAGYDTTKNQLILMMKVLLDHPEEWSKVADDPGRVQKVVDESLRFYSPVSATFRVTNVDMDYRGTLIPKDTMLMLPLTYAGRDESSMTHRIRSTQTETRTSPLPSVGESIFVLACSWREPYLKKRCQSWLRE